MYAHTKLYSAISYITWIGWIVAFILHDKYDRMTHHHLNQALAINILSILGGIGTRFDGIIGWAGGVIGVIVLILTIWGIIRALQLSDKPLPIVGKFNIL